MVAVAVAVQPSELVAVTVYVSGVNTLLALTEEPITEPKFVFGVHA